jgi:hypothetical protein
MSESPRIPIPTQFTAPADDDHPPLLRRIPEPIPQHERTPDMFGPRAAWPRHVTDDAPERDAEAVAATPAAPAPHADAPPLDPQDAPPEQPAAPVPIAAGTYSLYQDGAGGYVLVIGTSEGAVHHKHIPAKVVKMAEMAMGGNSPLAGLFG